MSKYVICLEFDSHSQRDAQSLLTATETAADRTHTPSGGLTAASSFRKAFQPLYALLLVSFCIVEPFYS